MTFFYREMPGLIDNGHLFLAMPPLYRLKSGKDSAYARDDRHKETLMATLFKGKDKVEISRFKGLGEMQAKDLKDTTMDPAQRLLLKVHLPDRHAQDTDVRKAARETADLVESLMGRKPELRFEFIQANAKAVRELDV
jgi:topoisomerase-4 subunit B